MCANFWKSQLPLNLKLRRDTNSSFLSFFYSYLAGVQKAKQDQIQKRKIKLEKKAQEKEEARKRMEETKIREITDEEAARLQSEILKVCLQTSS